MCRWPPSLPQQAFQAYLTEYEQAAEAYRHTYATIWQAGALLGAVAGALLAFAAGNVRYFSPMPLLLWYFGLFLPMDRYGEMRSARLRSLECILSSAVPALDMRHFRQFHDERTEKRGLRKRLAGGWRVKHAMSGLAITLLLVQLLLICAIWDDIERWLSSIF